MAEYTKAGFAKLLHRKNSFVANNITRGKIVTTLEGRVDTLHPLNRVFLEQFFSKNDIDGNAIEQKKQPTATARKANSFIKSAWEDFAEIDDGQQIPREETWINPADRAEMALRKALEDVPAIAVSEAKYKQHLAVKTEKDSTLLGLKIEKLKGEVIPTAPIASLIFNYKQHCLTQNKITMERFLGEISHKYDVTGDDKAYFRNYFIGLLNNAVEEANNNFIKDLDKTLRDFSVKKGVGERN